MNAGPEGIAQAETGANDGSVLMDDEPFILFEYTTPPKTAGSWHILQDTAFEYHKRAIAGASIATFRFFSFKFASPCALPQEIRKKG